MGILVIAEHDNQTLKPATRNAVTAATKLGSDITILVAGQGCQAVADAAAKVAGVTKVLIAEAPELAHGLPENLAPLVVELGGTYEYLIATATSAMRLEKPHSLSYQAITETKVPSITLVWSSAKEAEAGLWLKSTDTSLSCTTSRMPLSDPSAAPLMALLIGGTTAITATVTSSKQGAVASARTRW